MNQEEYKRRVDELGEDMIRCIRGGTRILKTGLAFAALSAGLIAGAFGVTAYRNHLASSLPDASARAVAQPYLQEMEGISDDMFRESIFGLAASTAWIYLASRRKKEADKKHLYFIDFARENAPEGAENGNN